MVDSFSFIPNMRLGAASSATLDADGRRVLDMDVAVLDADGDEVGGRIGIPARFRGPGDVVGLSSEAIARVEPVDGEGEFEPDYFPFVELRDADLPWRYSLSDPGEGKALPWLVLIALKTEEFARLGQGSATLPRLRVHSAAASLPPLGQRWATAHVQLTGAEEGEAARSALAASPARGFARLMCLRKLEPLTRYTLFVVPAYEAGRQAGMGAPVSATDEAAWDVGEENGVDLPYFFTSTFRTSDATNLEAALRKLRATDPQEAQDLAGSETFRLDHPGYYSDQEFRKAVGSVQTALVAQGKRVGRNPTGKALQDLMVKTLTEVVAGEGDDPKEDPLVAFPPYGFRYLKEFVLATGQGDWFGSVNLDLRHRLTASLGAGIVRQNQEEFAQLAWDQYEELLEANRRLARLEAAGVLAERVEAQHFSNLPADVSVAVSEPMLPYASAASAGESTVGGVMRQAGSPVSYATRDLRRISARYQTRDAETGALAIAQPMLPGDQTPSKISAPRDNSAVGVVENRLAARNDNLFVETELQQVFKGSYIGPVVRPRVPSVAVGTFKSTELRTDLGQSLSSLPAKKAQFRVQGRSPAEEDAGSPIYRSPRLAVHLADYMVRLAPDRLLAGAGELPENSITFFTDERMFQEALFAGANHAMNEELRWRGFPTDLQGTLFRRFWNRGAPPDDLSQDDIGSMLDWSGGLGKQPNPANPKGRRQVVVVIKGEVVRKLDQPILRIDRSATTEWSETPQRSSYPTFSGKLRGDTAYYGFGLSMRQITGGNNLERSFFVIMEPRGRLRFGLDVSTRAARIRKANQVQAGTLDTWDDLGWSNMELTQADYVRVNRTIPQPPNADRDLWGQDRTSASLARSFWQKPVAAVLPLSLVIQDA